MNSRSSTFINNKHNILPNEFQETVISYEMKFKKENTNITYIKTLLYLYSTGTEYYDSINNFEIAQYYIEKTMSLIGDPVVSKLLQQEDTIKKNQNTQNYLNLQAIEKTFRKEPSKKDMLSHRSVKVKSQIPFSRISINDGVKHYEDNKLTFEKIDKSVLSNADHNIPRTSRVGFTNNIRKEEKGKITEDKQVLLSAFKPIDSKNLSTIKKKKKECENTIVNEQIKNEFKVLDSKVNNVEETIKADILKQTSNFHELKQKKKKREKKIDKLPVVVPIIGRSRRPSSVGRRGSKYDVLIDSLTTPQKGQYDIMKDILEYSEKKAKISQEKMIKEIEDYQSKNIKEMNEAIEEIRFSYSEDMRYIDGNVFPEIMEELIIDMNNEINTIKERYEDTRNKEIEKIKAKYILE